MCFLQYAYTYRAPVTRPVTTYYAAIDIFNWKTILKCLGIFMVLYFLYIMYRFYSTSSVVSIYSYFSKFLWINNVSVEIWKQYIDDLEGCLNIRYTCYLWQAMERHIYYKKGIHYMIYFMNYFIDICNRIIRITSQSTSCAPVASPCYPRGSAPHRLTVVRFTV